MRERTFVSAFHGFLDTVRDGHPDTPLAIVTPVICPVAEEHPGPTPFDGDYRVAPSSGPRDWPPAPSACRVSVNSWCGRWTSAARRATRGST